MLAHKSSTQPEVVVDALADSQVQNTQTEDIRILHKARFTAEQDGGRQPVTCFIIKQHVSM